MRYFWYFFVPIFNISHIQYDFDAHVSEIKLLGCQVTVELRPISCFAGEQTFK